MFGFNIVFKYILNLNRPKNVDNDGNDVYTNKNLSFSLTLNTLLHSWPILSKKEKERWNTKN